MCFDKPKSSAAVAAAPSWDLEPNIQCYFSSYSLDPRTLIPLYWKQMSTKLNHPMTPAGGGCKQAQLTQLLLREVLLTN